MLARTAEFKSTPGSVKMVNAWEVTKHWNHVHLQTANLKVQKTVIDFGVDFKTMRPRQVAGQLAVALRRGKNVVAATLDRARYVTLYRKSRSLVSLRSGVKQWHVFAVNVLLYKENLSAPPRSSEDVPCWLACFAHQGTAINYVGYLKNFCEVEGLSMQWYDDSVKAWRNGASKLKLVHGFKHTNRRIPFTWEWIRKLIVAFDTNHLARFSLFIVVCWNFRLRPFSEAFPMQVGDERDACSLPDDKHSSIWIDRSGKANLRLQKRKHRPRGLHTQRTHICDGHSRRACYCLPCRLQIALAREKYGNRLFPASAS